SVIESKYVWYSEEEDLTKKFCVQEGYQKVVPVDDPNTECCACDQAKYEMEFIGIWSKETHPKDYPTLEHLTHFTDMLGASHSKNYSLWKIGEVSTDGMKEIAEWGNTFKAEAEAKEKAAEVRTLMKVKGLWYPEVQSRTKANFVVNNLTSDHSPNSPQEPRVPIKWITTKDDPLSPFYSTETDVIPPIAKLILRRT
ncbi:unnamed protein product, partial [Cylicostephanus goldi]